MAVLWEQWDEEPHRAFAAFMIYRDLPASQRSLPNAYRVGTSDPTKAKVSGQWRRWAETYAWQTRAAAYDQYIDAIRRKAAEKEIALQTRKQVREIEISAMATLKENAALAMSNIADVVEWDENGVRVKPSSELPEHVTAAVAKVTSTTNKYGTSVTVEMHPKVRPIDLQGQHFSLWDSEKKQQEKAATNSFLELLANIKSGKFDEFVRTHKPSVLRPPPGIVIETEGSLMATEEELEKAKNEL